MIIDDLKKLETDKLLQLSYNYRELQVVGIKVGRRLDAIVSELERRGYLLNFYSDSLTNK